MRVCSDLGLNHGTVLPKSVVHEGRTRSSSKLLWVSTLVLFAAACGGGGGGGGGGGVATAAGSGGTTSSFTVTPPPPDPKTFPICSLDSLADLTCDPTTHQLPTAQRLSTVSLSDWTCVTGRCPLADYGIWLKFSHHGVAEFRASDPAVLPFRGGLSYGVGPGGNRQLAGETPTAIRGTTFVYTGRAVAARSRGLLQGHDYADGNVRINIAATPAPRDGDPVEVIIRWRHPPNNPALRNILPTQMAWNYDLGIVLENGSFSYDAGTGAQRTILKGQYYGPNHEEFGGVFGRDGWNGAYGAEKLH